MPQKEAWRLLKEKKGGLWDIERVRFLANGRDLAHVQVSHSFIQLAWLEDLFLIFVVDHLIPTGQ